MFHIDTVVFLYINSDNTSVLQRRSGYVSSKHFGRGQENMGPQVSGGGTRRESNSRLQTGVCWSRPPPHLPSIVDYLFIYGRSNISTFALVRHLNKEHIVGTGMSGSLILVVCTLHSSNLSFPCLGSVQSALQLNLPAADLYSYCIAADNAHEILQRSAVQLLPAVADLSAKQTDLHTEEERRRRRPSLRSFCSHSP